MTTFCEPIDWLDCAWSGPFDDEDEEIACCAGDCYFCNALAEMFTLPIYGPINKDGVSLGFLLVSSKIEC